MLLILGIVLPIATGQIQGQMVQSGHVYPSKAVNKLPGLFYFRSRPWVYTFRFHLYTEPLTGVGVSPNNFPWSWVTRIAISYPVSDPNQKYRYQEAFSKPRAFKKCSNLF